MSEDVLTEDPSAADEPSVEIPMAHGCPVTDSFGQVILHPAREHWLDVATALYSDGYNMCIDLTAVDYLIHQGRRQLPSGIEAERFEIVASFISHQRRERIRARIQVPAEDPSIGSLYALYPGSDFLEREVFDLFGIDFVGHPDLSRILMPEHWVGHPLRKDYDIGAIPVQFKGAPGPR